MTDAPFQQFLFLNALGALTWTVVIEGSGYLFAQVLELFLKDLRHYEMDLFALLAIIGALFWLIHFLRGRVTDIPEH